MSYTPQEQLSIKSVIGVNSDTVTSGGNQVSNTYTGAGELNNYAYVGVNLQVDESGTLYFDFSQDGTNWFWNSQEYVTFRYIIYLFNYLLLINGFLEVFNIFIYKITKNNFY